METEVLILPVIGQTLREGEDITTERLELRKEVTKRVLQGYLEGYNLSTSGKRDVLIQRLREYAKDKDQWIGQFKPAQRRIRRSATGTRVDKRLAKRIRENFGDDSTEIAEYPSKRVAITNTITAGSQSGHRVAQFTDWAAAVLAPSHTAERLPIESDGTDRLLDPDLTIGSVEGMEAVKSNTTVQIMSRSLHRVEEKFDQLADVLQKMAETARTLQPSAPVQTTAAPVTFSRPAEHIITAERSASSYPRPAEHNGNRPMASHLWPVFPHSTTPNTYHFPTSEGTPGPGHRLQDVSSNTNIVTIDLGEMQLTFDPATVPNPPTVTFADDIERLVEEWDHSTRLVVAGKGIPIRYWDKLYTKRAGIKEHAWSSLRCSWGNWKFVVEEYASFPSPTAFWDCYSDAAGVRMKYQGILDRLKSKRQVAERESYGADAAAARQFFNGNLGQSDAHGKFTYRKNGRSHIYQKDKEVATRWRQLLDSDESIRARWLAMSGGL
ncbi:hypothetical protein HWV62_38012 [Athelia sp. TMB]|nr:hypothetical protein HWV62_38012 [Athelia sp. TMB]